MAFSNGSSLSARCSVWDLWYFTSVIQKLFFHILTPGRFEKMLPQKGFMADVILWEAPCGFWHSSGTYHFPKCLSTTPKSMRMRSVKCSSWCPMDTDVFEVVALLLRWPFLNVTIDHLSCRSLLIHHELWLTSGGVSGLGRQEAPGQHRSGWWLKAVGSLVLCQCSSGYSVMRHLVTHAQTCKTHNGIQRSLSELRLMDWNVVETLEVLLLPLHMYFVSPLAEAS